MMARRRFRRILRRDFDYLLFACVLVLVVIGIVFVYSATVENAQVAAPLHTRQLILAAIGLVALAVAVRLPLQFYYSTAYLFYGLMVSLLIALALTGGGEGGRWFELAGGIRLQPSEPAKIFLVMAVARYLSGHSVTFRRARDYLVPILLAALPFLLVARQPDLGTAMIFPVILIPMLYWRGVPMWTIFLICSPLLSVVTAFDPITWGIAMVIIGTVIWRKRIRRGLGVALVIVNVVLGVFTPVVWDNLHAYQQQRIMSFIDPGKDPLGAGYQIIQSTVAVGSGGLAGKGYLQGTQTKLNFLPEQHTDFIFSVIAEETGLIGALVVLLLFGVILLRALRAAAEVKNIFSGLVIIGTTGIIFAHVMVNIGMALGLLPITGLPLPLVSYGGSHLVTTLFMIGIILSLRLRWMEY